jgi:Flp pilus assembly protein TadB
MAPVTAFRDDKAAGAVDHFQDDQQDQTSSDWWQSVRLATLYSFVAGLAALVLAGHVPDTTIIVSIIVAGTVVSWLQLDGAPQAATVRHPRRHRDR